MSAHSPQWVEIKIVTTRKLKVLINIITPDCLEGMTLPEILEASLGMRGETPRDHHNIIGTCAEPEEWL